MAVPKKRTSSSMRDMRRSHLALVQPVHIEACPSCGEPKRRHHVCLSCGSYRGRKAVAKKDA